MKEQEQLFLQQLREDTALAIAAIRQKEEEITQEIKKQVNEHLTFYKTGMKTTAEMATETASYYHQTKESLLIQNEALFLSEAQQLFPKFNSTLERSKQLEVNLSKELKSLSLEPSPGPTPLTNCVRKALGISK